MGFSSEEILSIFKILAAILKLGNLNFIPITNIDGTEGCEISNDYGKSACEVYKLSETFWKVKQFGKNKYFGKWNILESEYFGNWNNLKSD